MVTILIPLYLELNCVFDKFYAKRKETIKIFHKYKTFICTFPLLCLYFLVTEHIPYEMQERKLSGNSSDSTSSNRFDSGKY